MEVIKMAGKVILAVAMVLLTVELLFMASNVVSYIGRGYDLQTAIQWEIDSITGTWATLFPEKPERNWIPMANQNIDWSWQFKGER